MGKRFENPLLSDKRLREMYVAMMEARLVGEGMRRGKERGFRKGLEACWIGSAIGLRDSEGDFASAGKVGAELDLVLGLELKAAARGERSPKRLDSGGLEGMERVCFALGAASRMVGHKTVGLVYAKSDELNAKEWKQALAEALRMDLPVVLIAIPSRGVAPGVAELSSRCGVPGIPVDASDAVAIYRVAQESIGRARAGGGPALIEGIVFPGAVDPLRVLAKQLLAKRVVRDHWAETVEEKFRARLKGLHGMNQTLGLAGL